ncbi:MAG: hypothetical protein JSV75_01945 [Candidatus Bathyarchaeota archaeon]|nr:MAG: hypothetical protein JSV75_01945 [Candidatus Bathyarchaeota archaeon]
MLELGLMLESGLRKMVSVAAVFIGFGYVLSSIVTVIMLTYFSSQYPIESVENLYWFSGIVLFVIASFLLVGVGVFLVVGGLKYLVGTVSQKIMFIGIMLSSFYLLCLGTGSALALQQVDLPALLLVATGILFVASATVFLTPSFRLKSVACLLGILGGISLAAAAFDSTILDLVFMWNIPFPGPFMCMAILEGLAIVLVSITALVYSVLGDGEKPTTDTLLSLIALVYGVGVFIGSLVLSLNLLNLVWKAPWDLALYQQPTWVVNTVIFWAASLGMLGIGGIVLILSACAGFLLATRKLSQL